MRNRLLLWLLGVPAALLLFLMLTFLFIPNRSIRELMIREAAGAGYTLDCPTIAKRLPLGIKAKQLALSSDKGELLRLREARVNLKLLPLLTGKTRFGYSAFIGSGRVEGEITIGKRPGWSVQGTNIPLEDIPFFANVAQARVRGLLGVTGGVNRQPAGDSGELKLRVQGAELSGVKIGDMPLPDASYRQVQGALSIAAGRATLKSFALEGDGVYVRLKGDAQLASPLGNSPLNMTVDILPTPAFMERQKFVFLLLTKYLTSPGAYAIPIRGTLSHPAMQ